MTVLDRMVRKGELTRHKVGRAFVYAPRLSREALRRTALQEFLNSYFEGSREELLSFLQEDTAKEPALVSESRLDTVLL